MKVSNILVDEDSQVSFEQYDYESSEWKEWMDDGGVLASVVPKAELIEQLNKWVVDEKAKWDDEEYLSNLDTTHQQLLAEINAVDESKIVGYGEWGVEYDNNFCIVVND